MSPDVRGAAKRVFGGNCTFSDDDLMMLEHFAGWAVDQGYRGDIKDRRTRQNIAKAKALRALGRDSDRNPEGEDRADGLRAEHESAGRQASPNSSRAILQGKEPA